MYDKSPNVTGRSFVLIKTISMRLSILICIFLITTTACEDDTVVLSPEEEEEEPIIPPTEEEGEMKMMDSSDVVMPIDTSSINPEMDTVGIRLSNVSDYLFEDIVVITWDEEVAYADLPSEEVSDYEYHYRAYRYGFIELTIDCDTFTLQPIDYVGEIPLKQGKYTYQLDADESDNRYSKLQLTLIED